MNLKKNIPPVEEEQIKKLFGRSVRHWRRHMGLSQTELARRVGFHRTYLSDVERGKRNPSLLLITRIAKELPIPITLLFEPPAE